ncbi:nucleoside hydrolase [Microbacterium sp. 22242]|uniref:nucleoside hydrolase n=1 Tax=Microbacterium sp. 22242 TaxID=3453896 RepID=UPI003F85D1CA
MRYHLERHRVLIDNDWAGDPDGLAALAHHLLSPTDEVVAVTSSSLSPVFGDPAGTALQGATAADQLLRLMGEDGPGATAPGRDEVFRGERRESAAAARMVQEARGSREGSPLLIVCGGPLTNVADALRTDPGIVDAVTLAWVGGSADPGQFEYNRDTDPAAHDFVFSHDALTICSFPLEAYRSISLTVAELEDRLTSAGAIGAWLWERYANLPLPPGIVVDPIWPLGDSAPLALSALGPQAATYRPDGPHRFVCDRVEGRLIIEDFFARLRLRSRRCAEAEAASRIDGPRDG